jgi:hypothetical protein
VTDPVGWMEDDRTVAGTSLPSNGGTFDRKGKGHA